MEVQFSWARHATHIPVAVLHRGVAVKRVQWVLSVHETQVLVVVEHWAAVMVEQSASLIHWTHAPVAPRDLQTGVKGKWLLH